MFMIRSMGGEVSWDNTVAPGSTYQVNSWDNTVAPGSTYQVNSWDNTVAPGSTYQVPTGCLFDLNPIPAGGES